MLQSRDVLWWIVKTDADTWLFHVTVSESAV